MKFAQIARDLTEGDDYTVDEKQRAIALTEEGINKAEAALNISNIYSVEGMKYVHHLETAVKAKALFLREREYVVKDNEVIIVDDGSNDETLSLIEKFIKSHRNFTLLKVSHGGKAAAVMAGMKKAQGNYVLFTDMDQATPLYEWEKLFPWFEKGFDIVIGSRAGVRKGAPFFRKTMAKGFMILRNVLLSLGIEDTQCGFKAFKKDAVEKLTHTYSMYSSGRKSAGSMVTAGFDVELLFMAKEMGFKIKEVPVEWHYRSSVF
jgi:glycosyltransferase involved in cell wall biosynthesis